jgi:hypothetical protein
MVSQLQFGLVDTTVGYVKEKYEWVDLLLEMSGNKHEGIGYKIDGDQLYTVNLKGWPIVKNLYRLTNLRIPLFEVLFNIFNIRSARNQIGYTDLHKYLINYAISNPRCVKEYAYMFDIDENFAKQELSLMVNATLEEEFSLFTICEFWKEKINKCETDEDAEKCMYHLLNNFNKPDLYE